MIKYPTLLKHAATLLVKYYCQKISKTLTIKHVGVSSLPASLDGYF